MNNNLNCVFAYSCNFQKCDKNSICHFDDPDIKETEFVQVVEDNYYGIKTELCCMRKYEENKSKESKSVIDIRVY